MNQITDSNRFLFEELTERIRARHEAAGIAVAIVDKSGTTQYEQFFGLRDVQKGLPIDQDTIFGLASITKSFVALSVMQLYEAGIIELSAPVNRYIPEFTNANQKPVTVAHFLSHSGGFYPVHRTVMAEVAERLHIDLSAISDEADDPAFSDLFAAEGTAMVAAGLDAQTAGHGLIGEPGTYMSYCNDGFGLLSEIVHRMGGEPSFAAYVKKHILEPLGMERSGADYIRPFKDANAAVLYEMRNGKMTGGYDYFDNAFVLGGAGSMKSTLNDMKRYGAMYLNYGRALNGARLLSMEGIRAMECPRIEYRADSHYCYGLSTKKLDDLTVIEHGGSLTGVSTNLSWSHDAGAAVIVLCNTSDVPVSTIADAAMRMYHGRCPLDRRDTYQDVAWSDEKKLEACGVYQAFEDSGVEIYLENGDVKVKIGGKEKRFVPVQENLGIIRNPDKDAPLKLFEDDNGRIFAVSFGGRMLPKTRK